jgi:hypothetical protein
LLDAMIELSKQVGHRRAVGSGSSAGSPRAYLGAFSLAPLATGLPHAVERSIIVFTNRSRWCR